LGYRLVVLGDLLRGNLGVVIKVVVGVVVERSNSGLVLLLVLPEGAHDLIRF
tara:strand:- start:513 stop:668 length:156 start_codon:yes stop_codon:yes gene_type:complete